MGEKRDTLHYLFIFILERNANLVLIFKKKFRYIFNTM